jgi:hypothetical protein
MAIRGDWTAFEYRDVAAAVQEVDHVDARFAFNHDIEHPRQCIFSLFVCFGGVYALDPVSVFLANILRKFGHKLQEYLQVPLHFRERR